MRPNYGICFLKNRKVNNDLQSHIEDLKLIKLY